jgi:hypothetical protein
VQVPCYLDMSVGSDCGNSSFLCFGHWRNRSQKSEMMIFSPLLPPHRLYVTTFPKIYAGLSPKDDEPKIQKKNTDTSAPSHDCSSTSMSVPAPFPLFVHHVSSATGIGSLFSAHDKTHLCPYASHESVRLAQDGKNCEIYRYIYRKIGIFTGAFCRLYRRVPALLAYPSHESVMTAVSHYIPIIRSGSLPHATPFISSSQLSFSWPITVTIFHYGTSAAKSTR